MSTEPAGQGGSTEGAQHQQPAGPGDPDAGSSGAPSAREDLRRRSSGKGENRLPPTIAVLVAIGAYAMLPDPVLAVPRYLIPGLELVLLVALVATNSLRVTNQSRISRLASVLLAVVIVITNLVALGYLVAQISSDAPGEGLLLGAMQIWVTNVIGFGLLYWEIDRGGPVARRVTARADLQPADWRFSQDEDRETVVEVRAGSSELSDWVPVFGDYLYMSLTNSSAFSPTDTMPLSLRAKALMGIQATSALLTSLLVVARAVGSLGGGN